MEIVKQIADRVIEGNVAEVESLTKEALEIAKKNIVEGEEEKAKEIILMVECYLSDSVHFEKEGHLVDSYGCLNYAHGWLDCGARLKIFNVKDNHLFTV